MIEKIEGDKNKAQKLRHEKIIAQIDNSAKKYTAAVGVERDEVRMSGDQRVLTHFKHLQHHSSHPNFLQTDADSKK